MRRSRSGLVIAVAYASLWVVWSTTWIGIKVGLHGAPPLMGAGLRFLLAGACFAVFRLARDGSLRVPRPHWRFLILTAGSMFSVPYALVYLGETEVTSGLAAVLFATLPLFSALIADRFNSGAKVTVIGFAGVSAPAQGLP